MQEETTTWAKTKSQLLNWLYHPGTPRYRILGWQVFLSTLQICQHTAFYNSSNMSTHCFLPSTVPGKKPFIFFWGSLLCDEFVLATRCFQDSFFFGFLQFDYVSWCGSLWLYLTWSFLSFLNLYICPICFIICSVSPYTHAHSFPEECN